jgi:outer membrane protein assembly factor BamA
MYRRIALAVFTLCISVYSQAQQDPERKWTDKNNAGQYAAYMIQIAYYERGYMGVRVQVRDDSARKTFEVDPGRIYHIKAMQILGQNDLPAEAMSTAPTVGDVYSAARINEWIATLKSQYKKAAS